MQGLPGNPSTDASGYYVTEVPQNWSGTVTPAKTGWIFTPSARTYTKVTINSTAENFAAKIIQFSVEGTIKENNNIPLQGVVLSGLPHNPTTDSTGFYRDSVQYGWSGSVTPQKTGFQFTPAFRSYNSVTAQKTAQNYNASQIQYTISGFVRDNNGIALSNVIMNGLPGNPQTGTDGFYNSNVPFHWSGTVIPQKEGYYFTPQLITYSSVNSHQEQQNYIASVIHYPISGHVRDNSGNGITGVNMNGLPDSSQTNNKGFYIASVAHGWSGTVMPSKDGLFFSPSAHSYTNITTGQQQQDYIASTTQYIISGTIKDQLDNPLGNVMVEGFPGKPVTDDNGFYLDRVPQNWVGTVIPVLDGWKFLPAHRSYSNVNVDLTQENYTASVLYFPISGFVKDALGVPTEDVLLDGLPGTPVTDSAGFYSDSVQHGWSGTVTPMKSDILFSPASKFYANVTTSQDSQNYIASAVQFTIAGMVTDKQGVPVSHVLLQGLPGDPITNENGFYSDEVPQNWSGTVKPVRTGLQFQPSVRSYSNIVSNKMVENYTASVINLTLSGFITDNNGEPVSGVQLDGLPHIPFTDSSGFFSDSVLYGWSGNVIPVKNGLLFSPPVRLYSNLTSDQIPAIRFNRISFHPLCSITFLGSFRMRAEPRSLA
jgi:protocatechuate 3,4-dioxygenase beta subunit